MNINDLIGADEGLQQSLMDLDLSGPQLDALGLMVSEQLAQGVGFDLGGVLGEKSSREFLAHIDADELAHRLDVDLATVQSSLELLAASIGFKQD